jgi:hypothetical protein
MPATRAIAAAALVVLAACGHSAARSVRSTPSATTSAPTAATPGVSPSPSASPVQSPSPVRSPLAPTPTTGTGSTPAPLIITEADADKTFTLAIGSSAQVQLPDTTRRWSNPTVVGTGVTVNPIATSAGSGIQEWGILAISAGRATLHFAGTPICTGGTSCPMNVLELSVTIVVP